MMANVRRMQSWKISVGRWGSEVIVGRSILPRLGGEIRSKFGAVKVAVVSAGPIWTHHGEAISATMDAAGLQWKALEIPDGEAGKSWDVVGELIESLAAEGFDRASVLVAAGGGAIGDAAGFAAATFMRGIALIQLPTTLLAMVDSSLGGKTGVNLSVGKNLAGAIHQPRLIFVDTDFLATLSQREVSSGTAEIIKYGVIADAGLFAILEKNGAQELAQLVERCLRIKGRVVEQDEYEEKDVRALLNFGHTIGHAIEAAAGYGTLLHGEAVSIGMNAAAYLSERVCGFSGFDALRLRNLCKAHGLPLEWQGGDPARVEEIMMRDKKFKSGRMRFVLARRIGECFVGDNVPIELVREAIRFVVR